MPQRQTSLEDIYMLSCDTNTVIAFQSQHVIYNMTCSSYSTWSNLVQRISSQIKNMYSSNLISNLYDLYSPKEYIRKCCTGRCCLCSYKEAGLKFSKLQNGCKSIIGGPKELQTIFYVFWRLYIYLYEEQSGNWDEFIMILLH